MSVRLMVPCELVQGVFVHFVVGMEAGVFCSFTGGAGNKGLLFIYL